MSPAPRHDWHGLVRRHARQAGADLAPSTIDELAGHLDDLYDAARDRGVADAAAYQAALDALTNSSLLILKDDARRDPRLTHAQIANDVATANRTRGLAMFPAIRVALRQFRQHPTFALLTVLVLGLGTGAAATVYTIVDAVVLRPLPYREPDKLVALWDSNAEKGLPHEPLSPVTFMDYRGLSSFEDAAAWWRPDVNLVDPGLDPVRVKTIETSANLFSLLGVSPQVGPGFPTDDGHLFSRDLVAVISARLWRTRYNADPSIVGKQLRLNDTPYTVVGVMADAFDYPGDIDVWQRLRWDLTQHDRNAHFMEAVARLKPTVTLNQAREEGIALAGRLGDQFKTSNRGWSYQFVPVLDDALGYYRPALLVMFGAVGVLLLIGCLNVASLLLTRALARDREIAVRAALGATRRHLITQLLAESLVLSAAGMAVGLVIAAVALPMILALTPLPIPRLAGALVNGRVLAFVLGLGVLTTIAFGFVPALVLLRRQLATHLRTGDRGSSRGSRLLYQGFVVSEVALACALLVGAALLVRTVGAMTTISPGVGGDNVTLTSVQLSGSRYQSWQQVADTHAAILARLRQEPGITSVGTTNFLPFETGWRNPIYVDGVVPANPADAPQVQQHAASDGYFEAMGARLVAGRFFAATDTSQAEGVAIVNEAFAQRYLANRDATTARVLTRSTQIGPLGRNLMARTLEGGRHQLSTLAIVGVVGDIRNASLGQPVEPAVYFPVSQFPFRSVNVAIAARDAATAIAAVRRVLREVTPDTPLGSLISWPDRLATRTAEPRVLMATLAAFGVLAAVLAALGVYGLFSWSVAARRRELAIRLTLGARPAGIGALVLRQGIVLAAIGLVGGWLIVRAAQGVLAKVLFGVSASDPRALGVAMVLLLAASIAACLPAALRAMRVDPAEGLRVE